MLAFHFTAPVNFDEEYQALLVSVAQHCAQALERARLYEAAQKARAEAETANRLKDEFVSIVSHELRTPLSAMLGWASMLEKGSLDAATAERAVRSIHDNATRQVRLVDELLDLSRLTSGRLTLVMGGRGSALPPARRRRLDHPGGRCRGARAGCRRDSAGHAAVGTHGGWSRCSSNLLGNALKFTSRGGRVGLSVIVEPAQV